MATDRCLTIGGPCKVVTCDAVYVTEGDVTVETKQEFRDLTSSLRGKVGRALTRTVTEIKFTPLGIPSYIHTLHPLQPSDIGSSIYGCADCYLEIQGKDGLRRRYKAAGIKKPPQMIFSSRKSFYGEVTFGVAVANNTDVATAGSVVTLSSGTWTEPPEAANPALWVSRCGQASWGTGSPWSAIHTDEGITVDVTYATRVRDTDCNGTVDEILTGVELSVTLTPANLSQADYATLVPEDGAGASPGYNLVDRARQLVIQHSPTPGGVRLTVSKAAPEAARLRWGRESGRYGDVTWTALGSAAGGVAAPLYTLETMPLAP